MADIICAIRAGVGSRAVQTAAIREARATDTTLVFLYAIDRRLVAACEESMQPSVRNELYWMGNTLVRIAVARANAAGLTRVTWAIREGDVREEIAQVTQDHQARLLFIGSTRHQHGEGDDSATIFATWVQATTGVAVEIVPLAPEGR